MAAAPGEYIIYVLTLFLGLIKITGRRKVKTNKSPACMGKILPTSRRSRVINYKKNTRVVIGFNYNRRLFYLSFSGGGRSERFAN